jgi:hypothetical protein
MTLQEIKRIAELAMSYNRHRQEDQIAYSDNCHIPVSEAIAANDITVIAFLETCDKDVRKRLSPAIEDGVLESRAVNEGVVREGYERAVNLYKSVYGENGYNIKI